jgi:hypothetical protein
MEPNLPPPICSCGAQIGGGGSCHCPTCHDSFSNVRAFDAHRQHGVCVSPRVVGLVQLTQAGWTRWKINTEKEEVGT